MNLTRDFFNLILDFGDEWVVQDVETDHKECKVILHLKYCLDTYEDPLNKEEAVLFDHANERRWRHLDILDYTCYVCCRIPRVRCFDGKVRQIRIGWADKHDRHTHQFESRVIDLLQATKNQTKAAEFLGCSPKLVNRIMHRSVSRGMERRELSKVTMEHLSIDEKSFKEGHNYVSVLSHPKTGTVIDVSDGRDTRAVDMLFETALTQEQRESVRTISLDMWKPYMNSSEDNLPNAEMVHDKFHLVAYLNKSIDLVRRREVKKNEELKYTRFIFLKTPINLTERQQEKFELIKRANFEVTHAWECCQNFKDLFEQCSEENEAATLLFSWIGDVYKKCIKEVSKVAQMFARHARGVINAMMTNINNAMAERLNGKIQEIKTSGRGYRTFESFRSAILFWNGGLDLYPRNWA